MRPNIVVIQADQMAAQALGAYGDTAAKTPHMDALAREGAVFDRAYCNTPLCAPSRASMMTGMMPSALGCYDNGDDFAASVPTFAHHLRGAGYHTALVGRMHFIGPDQHHGFEQRLTTDVYPADMDMVPDWNRPLDQRLQWYHDADAVFTAGVSRATVQQDFDDEVGFRTLRHLNDRVRANQAAGKDIPFLMVTSFIHPHDPYEPPQEHWDRFAEGEIPDPKHPQVPSITEDPHSHRLRQMSGFDRQDPTSEQVRRARRSYYAAVSYIDDHVGRIRDRLETLGLLENTVIIVTSDHGDMLGEKGLWYKMSPYEQSARVPLIMYGPDHLVPRGRYANPVSLLDLLPTLLELGQVRRDESAGSGTKVAGTTGAGAEVAGSAGAGAEAAGSAGAGAEAAGSEGPGVEGPGTDGESTATAQRPGVPHSGTSTPGMSLLESARREAAGQAGPQDRDVVIEYLAEGTLRPQLTLVRGQYKFIVCPGDPDQLFDLATDPEELHNIAGRPERSDLVQTLRQELQARYDLEDLEGQVLSSQARRRLVAEALQHGQARHWDYEPDPEQRYVRGDFWGALQFGQIR